MNGFENIEQRIELRDKFKEEHGIEWENSQGEPDIDYFIWLESLIIGSNPPCADIIDR